MIGSAIPKDIKARHGENLITISVVSESDPVLEVCLQTKVTVIYTTSSQNVMGFFSLYLIIEINLEWEEYFLFEK